MIKNEINNNNNRIIIIIINNKKIIKLIKIIMIITNKKTEITQNFHNKLGQPIFLNEGQQHH